jgi:hypothetical protein
MGLFTEYTHAITALKSSDLSNKQIPEFLLIDRNQQLSTWYSPFDYINTQAKIVIVGITPGHQQATNALLKARDVLQANGSEHQAKLEAKVFASFSGAMRGNLIEMLDYIGINNTLSITSTRELFEDKANLVHFTSALRYPVMKNGENYNGTPSMIRTPFLIDQLKKWFGSECQTLPNAIYVALGPVVMEALQLLEQDGILNSDKIIEIPHPSPASNERINYFLMKKDKKNLSSRTNGDKLDEVRSAVLNKVKALTI